ncbi:plastocyanin/azurin family copper-binding protein [Blastococcus sp. SYSU D00813]
MSEAGLLRRRTARRGAVLAAGLVLSTVALAGCGGDDDGGGGAASSSGAAAPGSVTTAPDGVQEITLETPDDYVFVPDAFTVSPGRVRVTVRNTAEQMVHNFRFTPGAGVAEIDEEIPLLQPGESDTIEFEVTAVGDYPFDCSFHIQLGQVGTMTVAG